MPRLYDVLLAGGIPSSGAGGGLWLAVLLLCLPTGIVLAVRWAARQRTEDEGVALWLRFRRLTRFAMATFVAGWWALCDSARSSAIARFLPRFLEGATAQSRVFWMVPVASLGAFLIAAIFIDRAFLQQRWSLGQTVSRAWWRLASSVIPLLTIARGFDEILGRDATGFAWVAAAGLVAHIGLVCLQQAEGMKLHGVRSGELRNMALSMARKMGVTITRFYLTPEGKGHLRTAYSLSNAIGLTDNLKKYMTRPEIDFTIAHELAHIHQRHGRKKRGFVVALFSMISAGLFYLPASLPRLRPLLDLTLILVPMMLLYYVSKRAEYAADREAADFTGDPGSAVRALEKLHKVNAVPERCSRFSELFLTHPALERRIEAIEKRAAAGESEREHGSRITG